MAQTDLSYRSIWRVVIVAGTLWVAWQLRELILLVVFAALFAIALHPLVEWLQKKGMKRSLALFGVLFILVGLILLALIWVGIVFAREIVDLINDLPAVLQTYGDRFESVRNISDKAGEYLQNINAVQIARENVDTAGAAVRLVTGFFYAVGTIFFLTLYMLIESQYLGRVLKAAVPKRYQSQAAEIGPKAAEIVGGYLRGQLLTSALITVFGLLLFFAMDVPNAIALAIFLGITDAVPMVGALLGMIPAILLAWTVSPVAAVVVLVALLIYQQLESSVIVPKVYGKSLNLSPLVVTIATLAGAILLGAPGVLLALPTAALVSFILTKYHNIPLSPLEDKAK